MDAHNHKCTVCVFAGVFPVYKMAYHQDITFTFERLLLTNAESGPLYTPRKNPITTPTEASYTETNIIIFHDKITIEFYGNEENGFAVWYQRDGSRAVERIFPMKTDETECVVENLLPGTKYNLFIVKYKNGKKINLAKTLVTTKICGQPSNLAVDKIKNKLRLTWKGPVEMTPGFKITGYTLKMANYSSADEWHTIFYHKKITSHDFQLKDGTNEDIRVGNYDIDRNCSYIFILHAHCGEYVGEEIKQIHLLPKHRFLSQSQHCWSPGKPIYEIDHTTSELTDNITTVKIGNNRDGMSGYVSEKVILLIGQTGSGKTTWINSIMNHVLDVKYRDNFRFKLIVDSKPKDQSQSQTTTITIYKICNEPGMNINFPLTIIDTPGFGDTAGMEKDKEIEQQLKNLLKNYVDHINAIAFVAASSSTRLTYTQRYVLDSFQRMFAVDIKENVYVLSTFADQENPPLKGVIEHHLGFSCKKFFPFNNSAFFDDIGLLESNSTYPNMENRHKDEDDPVDIMFWNYGNENFAKFIKSLDITPAKSLSLTKSVLKEREHIELKVAAMHLTIQKVLAKFDQLQKEEKLLESSRHMEADLRKKQKIEVTQPSFEKVPTPHGQNTTTCLECTRTCHESCAYENNADKIHCIAMDGNGNCRACPRKCNWKIHRNMPYIVHWTQVTVMETVEDIQARYERVTGKRCKIEDVIPIIRRELCGLATQIKCIMSEISRGLARLKEIAMLSNPLTQVEYIDEFIASERDAKKPGWAQRVEGLKKFREEAKVLVDISEGNYDPFAKYREEAERARKQNKNLDDLSVWHEISTIVDGSESNRTSLLWTIWPLRP